MSTPVYAKADDSVARGLDANVWQQSLNAYVSNNPLYGIRSSDDFVDLKAALTGTTSSSTADGWVVSDAANAGGTYDFANTEGADGVQTLSTTGTTNHFGAVAQRKAVVTLPTATTGARGRVCFECRVDLDDADTVFVGLGETGTVLIASSALPTAADCIGFYTDDNGATMTFESVNDNAGGTRSAGSFTIPAAVLAASGYQNLAFAVNKDGSVDIGVNGHWYGKRTNGIESANLPIEVLAPSLVCTNGGGTTAASIIVDSIDCFVENANA